jgi:N-acetyl-gamma-glutamylphosphate reductase
VNDALETEGWSGGFIPHSEHQPSGSVVALNAMALISSDGNLDDIDDLYDEVYGRSFFVRRIEDGDWDSDLVAGKPWAAYRLRVSPGEGQALLTIQTMADLNGKVGAAQLVHAMNVMAGFEESLGIA